MGALPRPSTRSRAGPHVGGTAQSDPRKVHNYWTIRTAPGLSCLFTAPLNRAHPAIEIIARVVNTDRYASLISFPLIVTGPDGLYPLEKGMPLVQVIPFRRDAAFASAQIRSETDEETAERERIRRSVSHPCTRGALLRPR